MGQRTISLIAVAAMALCTTLAAAQTAEDSTAFANAEWEILSAPDSDVKICRTQVEMFNSMQSISVIRYPAKHFRTTVCMKDGIEPPVTSVIGKQKNANLAINGSYFNMSNLNPVTFVFIDRQEYGRTTAEETMRTNGVLAIKKNGRKMDIIPCDTTGYDALKEKYPTLLASGPVLIDEGTTMSYSDTSSFYTWRHPRSVIGFTRDGDVLLVVIDGRFKGEGDGTTIAETAFIAKMLGMEDALNLDGGGSSTLWTDMTGVINHPSDNKIFDHAGERKVSNCILVYGK